MVEYIIGVARWVAGEAGTAFVNVAAHTTVAIIRLWIGMTIGTPHL